MKTRKAYISVIALLVMSVLMIMTLYLIHTTKLEYLILNSSRNNTQSFYQSEGKIYMSIYDEKYYYKQLYPIITDYFRTYPLQTLSKDIIIDNEDLEYGDMISKVKVNIIEKDGKRLLNLIAESDCRGIKTSVKSSISLFNEFFEIGEPILAPNLIGDNLKSFKILIEKIFEEINIDSCNNQRNIYIMESMNYNEIVLHKKDDNNLQISSYRGSMANPYVERFDSKEVIIIIREYGGNPVNFSIGEINRINEKIEMSGIIYIEGNIIISNNFKFNGIIIVKNGEIIVESNEKPNIRGIIISDNLFDRDDFIEKVDIVYDRETVYKYGTYLPGFINPKIKVIKSN